MIEPQVIIRCPSGNVGGLGNDRATIKQIDGSEFPLWVGKIDVHIDWQQGGPVTADIVAVGGLAVELTAGIRSIEIDRKKYRLVEVDHVTPMPEASAQQLHD